MFMDLSGGTLFTECDGDGLERLGVSEAVLACHWIAW